MDAKFDVLDAKFDVLNAKFDVLNAKFDVAIVKFDVGGRQIWQQACQIWHCRVFNSVFVGSNIQAIKVLCADIYDANYNPYYNSVF